MPSLCSQVCAPMASHCLPDPGRTSQCLCSYSQSQTDRFCQIQPPRACHGLIQPTTTRQACAARPVHFFENFSPFCFKEMICRMFCFLLNFDSAFPNASMCKILCNLTTVYTSTVRKCNKINFLTILGNFYLKK